MTTERFAYPLLPAFRHGAQTPWGGDALARLFHKAIPDARTGEAMEASTLEGLESRLEDGRPLSRADRRAAAAAAEAAGCARAAFGAGASGRCLCRRA